MVGLFLLLITNSLQAQYDNEYGFSLGAVSYLGDIGGKEKVAQPWLIDLKIDQSRWNLGFFYRRRLYDNVYVRADLKALRLQGADSLSLNPARVGRNLSFRNDVFQLDLRGEYVFHSDFDVGNTGSYETNMNLYVAGGGGVFYHNPKALYQGDWVALQPLQLEGKAYSKIQPHLIFAVGINYTFNKQMRLGFEVGHVFTFTDYLDDVSDSYIDTTGLSAIQKALISRPSNSIDPDIPHPNNYKYPSGRGDPTDQDGYFFANFTLSKVIKGEYKNKKFNPHKKRYKYISSKRKKKRTKAKF